MNVRRGIKIKIYLAFFAIAAVSLLVSLLISQFDLINLKNMTLLSNQQIGTQAAQSSEQALIEQAIEDNKSFAIAQAEIINQRLSEISKQLQTIANYVTYLHTNKQLFQPVVYQHPKDNTETGLQMQWILAPDMELTQQIKDEIYFYGNLEGLYRSTIQSNQNILGIYLTTKSGINTGYDAASNSKPFYFEGRDSLWYQNAENKQALTISNTYLDSFGRGLTVTMSMPCYDEFHEFVGVIALDILIEDLNKQLRFANLRSNGSILLFSEDNTVISAPKMLEENSLEIETLLGSNASDILSQMGKKMTGVQKSVVDTQDVYVIYAPIAISGWTLVIILPVHEIIQPAKQSSDVIKAIADMTDKELEKKISDAQSVKITVFLLITAVILFFTMKLSNNITKPILQLRNSIKSIGNGNLEYQSDITTGDEIEELSHAFENMTSELQKYVDNLAQITAEKERIATELNVATQIQVSMLPCIFPAYPDRPEIDIYASMTAAKEVGGDFYDFFMIDSDHLGLVIADVSGKSIPAALFMVIAKTLIKNHLQLNKSPSCVFEAVNNQLCENNEAGMFVTAFMGILEIPTGKFTYVNAGHNPPCILRHKKGFEWLQLVPGFVLAGLEDISYQQKEIRLYPGERLFLYTDGVTEAMNQKQQLFGEKRLLEVLNLAADKDVKGLLNFVQEQINSFASGTEQADDITMLAVEYKGGKVCG